MKILNQSLGVVDDEDLAAEENSGDDVGTASFTSQISPIVSALIKTTLKVHLSI